MELAKAVELSSNAKIGPCHATYVTQASCPDCAFKEKGCYAEAGHVGIITRKLNNNARDTPGLTARDIAEAEADAITQKLSGSLDLRIHVVGDCTTPEAAEIVSTAASRKTPRDRKAWSYTHAWRDVPREAWGKVSVLASCEAPEDVTQAREQGWATAVVVDKFPNAGAFKLPNGEKAFACPQQTHGVQCVKCRLCLKESDGYLHRRGMAIAFEVHGSGTKKIKANNKLVQMGSL
jgi:hypothetical protein